MVCLNLAIQHGDLNRLMVPTDSAGRKCGVDNGVIDKPFLLFFNLEKCIDARVPLFGCKTPQVCVEKCPTESFVFSNYQCREEMVGTIRNQLICQMGVRKEEIRSCADIENKINKDECARWYLPSNSCKCLESVSLVHHVSICSFAVECLHSLLFGLIHSYVKKKE